MATVPQVQVAVNASKVQVFWEVDLENYYQFWSLYWDTDSGWGDEAPILENIPNIADTYYSKHHVVVNFTRPVSESYPFYVRVKGLTSVGDDEGPTKYVPAGIQTDPMISQKILGYDPDAGVWRPIRVERSDVLPGIAGVIDVKGWTGI